MNIRHALVLSILVLSMPAGAATTQDIVNAFCPASVKVDGAGDPISQHDIEVTFTTGDLEHTGKALIVAAYSNGVTGAVRVLSSEGTGSLLGATEFAPSGHHPTLTLRDLDHDGRPEILLTFRNVRGPSEMWLYRWNGSTLTLLSPESHHGTGSSLHDPDFLDLDGDGTIEVIDFRRGSTVPDEDDVVPVTATYRVLALRNGALSVIAEPDYVFSTMRTTGKPQAVTESFALRDAAQPRSIVLINGDSDGKHRVSSARLVINEQTVVTERDLSDAVPRIELPMNLKSENTISAELQGEPGAFITVVIKRK